MRCCPHLGAGIGSRSSGVIKAVEPLAMLRNGTAEPRQGEILLVHLVVYRVGEPSEIVTRVSVSNPS